MEIQEVAELFDEFVGGEPPCSFNNMDEKMDDFCEEHCEDNDFLACWKHALEKWMQKKEEDEKKTDM